MDAGTPVQLALLETHAIWPLGFYVWLPSVPVKEEANTDNMLGHIEEEAIYREGSNSDDKSRLPESEENHGNISIKVEENTMESNVARCSRTEQLQSPMFQVSFGGDQVMMTCEEEKRLEHSFDAGNHAQLFHPWADENRHSSHLNNIAKGIKEEPRDENEPVVEVEGSPAGNRENGESYAVVKGNVEEYEQVSGLGQPMMRVKEEPANHPHPSCDDSMDLLAYEEHRPCVSDATADRILERIEQSGTSDLDFSDTSRGPGAFPVAPSSPSLDAVTECPNWVLLSYNELAEAVTQQVGERLDKDVKALLLPLEAKCSDLRAALRQDRYHMALLGKQLGDLMPKEQRKKSQAQEPSTHVKDAPEEDSHISAPVPRRLGKCLQESLSVQHAGSAVTSAVTRIADHQSQLDSNEAAEDGYQHDRLEVRRVAVAECQRNRAEVHGPIVARPRRKRPAEVLQPCCGQDSPENRIPCNVELPPGIPYNPDSFWDAPYSIWMD